MTTVVSVAFTWVYETVRVVHCHIMSRTSDSQYSEQQIELPTAPARAAAALEAAGVQYQHEQPCLFSEAPAAV